jgi:hypothetical protein
VSDYYDRLEVQLMRATARPLPRARRVRMALGRPRGDLFAAAAMLAVAAVVVVIFIGLRPSARPVEQRPAQHGFATVHNYGNTAMPELGNVQCEIRLLPPADARPFTAADLYLCNIHNQPGPGPRASGTASVGVKPGGEAFSIDASGLPPSLHGDDYAVWFLSGRRNPNGSYSPIPGQKPIFLGIVAPPVGAGGRLRVQGNIPTLSAQQATGHYRFEVTRQPHPSNTTPGRIALEGWMSF